MAWLEAQEGEGVPQGIHRVLPEDLHRRSTDARPPGEAGDVGRK